MRDELVVVFARAPVIGGVKTRLAASVGDAAALALYRWMLDRVIRALAEGSRRWDLQLAVTSAPEEMSGWLRWVDAVVVQRGGDLGERMKAALCDGLSAGYARVVIVGTDCPAVDSARIREAMEALMERPAVLGPAEDGGYYLLGGTQELPVFEGVPWSSELVAEITRRRLSEAKIAWRELSVEVDIDREADLARFEDSPYRVEMLRALGRGG